jgi:hypothetical protein
LSDSPHDDLLARRWTAALVFSFAFLLFLPGLGNGYCWDDSYLIVDNPSIQSFDGAVQWFTEPWGAGSGQGHARGWMSDYWRPMSQVSLAVDWWIGGGSPWIYHLTSHLFHALCSLWVALIVFEWARALGAQRTVRSGPVRLDVAALVAGLLFAAHPVHGEVVNIVSYRTSQLSAAAVLGGLYLHMRGGRGALASVPIVFAVGLLSKEDTIALPALMLGADIALGRLRSEWRTLLPRLGLTVAVAVAFLVVHAQLTTKPELDYFAQATGWETFCTMMKVYLLDVRLVLIGWPLTSFYDWSIVPITEKLTDPEVLAGLLLLATSLGLLGLALLRGWAVTALSLGVWLVALGPYSHLVPFFDVAGERFLYVASMGPCAGAGLGLARAMERGYRPRLLAGGVAAVVLMYSGMTATRIPHFRSTEALLTETVRLFPHSFHAHFGLGLEAFEQGRPDAAARHFLDAHALVPDLDVAVLRAVDALTEAGRADQAADLLASEIARRGSHAPPAYGDRLRALQAPSPVHR